MAKTAIWGQTYKVLLDTGLLDSAFILDSSTLNGTDILDGTVEFADVTEYVLSASIRRGRPDQLASMPIGNATLVLDDQASSRSFDPSNTASPFVQQGFGIAPMRYAQIYGGTAGDEPLFIGRVRDLDISYEQPTISRAIVSLVDDLSQLGRTNLTSFTPSTELTSARINTILDRPEVAYSTATRNIATGNATCGTVAYDNNDNVKTAIDAVVQAEDGRFFISRGGTATFQPTVDFTFGTASVFFSDTGGTAIGYQALSVGYGVETLYNRIQVGVEGIGFAVAEDSASIAEFGVQTLSLNDVPLNSLTAGTTLAQNLRDKYKDPIFRFDEISVVLNGLSPADAEAVSTLEIGDLVSITKTFVTGSPLSVTRTMFVEQISQNITPNSHTVTLGLGQAQLLTVFVLDSSELDDVDVGLG